MSFEMMAFEHEINPMENEEHGKQQLDLPIISEEFVENKNFNAIINNRVSKANVAFAFGENKLKNIRKDNELRKSFYPDMKNRASRAANKFIA
jgi:hypothetical protein